MLNKFNFKGRAVRVVEIDGEPWWVAADVCRCLELTPQSKTGAYTPHLRRLADDEKRTLFVEAPDIERVRREGKAPGRKMTVVAESGLYKLIMRSDKPEAREFQDWVTREVLPAIRRTGGYLLNEHARETAHADTRQSAPIPAEFMAFFQKQIELMDRMVALMERVVAPPAPEASAPASQNDTWDREVYTAREVAMKLRKAGAAPTKRELQRVTIKTGQELSALSRSMDEATHVVERHGYPVTAYSRAVVRAYAAQ